MNKKILLIIIFLLTLIILPFNIKNRVVYADESIEDNILEQLDNIDLDNLEKVLSTYGNLESFVIENDLKTTIKEIINGNYTFDYESVMKLVISILTDKIKDFLPLFLTIIGVGLLLSLTKEFNLTERKDIEQVLHIAFFGVILILVIVQVSNLVNMTKNSIMGINKIMEALFPILLTIMTALGSKTSVALFQPLIALLINFITTIITNFLLPIVLICLVFFIVSNLSINIKLDKISNFFMSVFKWSLGLIFTIFTAFTTLNGLQTASVDSVSIRTAKYTIRSYIPLVGNFLSESFNIIMASSVLIKNAIGFTGLLVIFSSVIMPIITILIFKLGLELCSGVLEPICDKGICDFLLKLSSLMTLLIAILLVCSFMYLILITLIMSTSNIF